MSAKIIFVITEDRFLWSHRLPIARAASKAGYEVIIATRVMGDPRRILDEGFRLIPIGLKRGSYNPFVDLRDVLQLIRIYRAEKPDLVHHVALKPVLYGSLAAIARRNLKIVNAMTGLGFTASSHSLKARVLRPLIWGLLAFLLGRPNQKVLLQNDEDMQFLMGHLGVPRERIKVIRGSGVDTEHFTTVPESQGTPVVLFASRMLWIKGIQEFVQAARLLREKRVLARFVLVGDSDPGSPSSVPREQLLEWQKSGAVEWWGHREDMPEVFRQANIVCLPSQGGEGVPKALIEAAATGRAIVATDVPGCRDIVQSGVNGTLVEPQNVPALANAIEELLKDPELRETMGRKGRQIAANRFSEQRVVGETLEMYRRLLGPQPSASFASSQKADGLS